MKAHNVCCSLVVCALISVSSQRASAQVTIDFEEFQTGAIVSQIMTSEGPIAVFGTNPFGSTIGDNTAVIFDSANPTGGDIDLGTPNGVAVPGGPGVGAAGESGPFINDQPMGKVLIIAANVNDTNPADGLVDDPNDTNNPDTTIDFDFSAIGTVTVNSLKVLDVEDFGNFRNVTFFDENDNQIGAQVPIIMTGDNGVATINFDSATGVARMLVMLEGSGAIDDIIFTVGEPMTGACCAVDGTEVFCQDGLTEELCIEELQGTFLGVGSTCMDDSDGDGVTDCFDLCPETDVDVDVDDNGCQVITLDAGGPYQSSCAVGASEMISFDLMGSFDGQLPPGASLQFTWSTTCPIGSSIMDENLLTGATLNLDTGTTGCPLSCTAILMAQVVDGGGNPFPGANTPFPAEAPVALTPAQMGACCNREQGGCTMTTADDCAQAGGDFFANEDCMGDMDADGVSDICDLCANTPAGVSVDLNGCQIITLIPGGPYTEICDANNAEMIEIDLVGNFSGQVPDGATLTTMWSTDCPGAVIDNPSLLTTTLTIDTSIADCPLECMVTLSGTITTDPGGNPVPGTPDPMPEDTPVTLMPEDMGACCNRTAGGCTITMMAECADLGGEFFLGETCAGDEDEDGVSDVCDLCEDTNPEDPADASGCAVINCDAGGPYSAPCTGGIVMVQLDGTVSGQEPIGNDVFERVSTWSTDLAGATFVDVNDEDTILMIDTGVTGCPLGEFEITLSCEFVMQPPPVMGPNSDGGGVNQQGLPTDMSTTTVSLFVDCNNNMTDDVDDITNGSSTDCNDNDIPDECEIDENSTAPGGPFFCTADCDPDCNNNGVPDECDIADCDGNPQCSDCNGNGIPDSCDIDGGTSVDCNDNERPDECEIDENSTAPGGPFYCTEDCDPDCNNNGIPDECDIDDGTSQDCNMNEIPDECDIAGGSSNDCNTNGIPDECEIDMNSTAPGGPFFCIADCDPDCNNNGVPDACDIADGTSQDANNNGIPDDEVCEDTGGPQPVPEQACCMMNGDCTLVMPADCGPMGGTPQGDGTTCEAVDCCDEGAIGFNILFSLLFHAPVCGGVCGITAIGTIAGMVMMRRNRRRLRRTAR